MAEHEDDVDVSNLDDGTGSDDDGTSVLDPPEIASVGAMPQPTGASPGRRGGRPKGSRNKVTVAREAAPTGVGAQPTTSRPAGKTGSYPDEVEGKIPNDADQLWMFVIDEITKNSWSPHDMEIRVDRKTPPPAGPVTEFEASAVAGDTQTSPATALRKYMRDWVHLPSGLQGPAVYDLHFCWKNQARFFRRGEMKMPSRNECIAMKQSEEARQQQAGVAGLPTSFPQPPQPHVSQPWPQPPNMYSPFQQVPPPQQPQQRERFDPDAERARIRHEVEREFEFTRMRQEIDELRRRPPQQPQYGPGMGNGYPPPQSRRGVGAPPQYQLPESDDERTARVVLTVLQQAGVLPQRGQQAPVGVGSPAITSAVQQASGLGDDFERAMDTVQRGKKVFKKMKEMFEDDDEETPKAKPQGTGAAPAEGEEVAPKIRFQGTGQRWKDGREVMMPIDQEGDPIFPTTMASAMMTGFANPFLLEPIAQGVGAVMQRMATMTGLGAQPQPLHDPSIRVQQQEQPQAAPAPVPYYPPQQMQQPPAPQPAPEPQSPPAESSTEGFNFT